MAKPQLPLLSRLLSHAPTSTAFHNPSVHYSELVRSSSLMASTLSSLPSSSSSSSSRIAYLLPPSLAYASTQIGCFASGSAAVPLCTMHTVSELAYYLEDSAPSAVVVQGDEFSSRVSEALASNNQTSDVKLINYDDVMSGLASVTDADAYEGSLLASHQVSLEDPALFIYTSGTTGKPKGVVHTHRSFTAQVTDLVKAWEWTADDHILHFLPLHHIHGIQNKLNSALYAGATVEFMRFNSPKLFDRLSSATDPAPSLFMGVPTVYAKLLEEARTRKGGTTDEQLQGSVSALSGMRLHVCGSAALPSTVMAGWKDLTSHTLLERYGMSELGMALGNPYKGDRHEGHVGVPFDSVEVRIFNPETGDEVPEGAGSGELQVRGGVVFKEYFGKPEATAKEFKEGWFCTGDIAEYNTELQSYKILGRASVDIIKSGGFKISALDIEREILEHPAVEEAVVLGVEDDIKGEAICVLLRLGGGHGTEGAAFGEGGLRGWMKTFTAGYKLPSKVQVLDEIPKNAMGKYAKKELKKLFL